MQDSRQPSVPYDRDASNDRRRRSTSVSLLVALGLLFVHAGTAGAAPIVVTYALSGGTTSGSFPIGDIVGGTASFVFENPSSLSRASFTGGNASVTQFRLTGTAGFFDLYSPPYSAYLGALAGSWALAPNGTLSGANGGIAYTTDVFLRAFGIASGAIFSGGTFQLTFSGGNYRSFYFTGVTGQEIAVPEPATSSLLGFGLLLATALGTGLVGTRRRR